MSENAKNEQVEMQEAETEEKGTVMNVLDAINQKLQEDGYLFRYELLELLDSENVYHEDYMELLDVPSETCEEKADTEEA